MKHLITGGAGFLGNLIARRLLEKGESVKILDIWEDPSRPSDIEFVKCDVRNREGIAKALKNIDIVHHNAALVPLTKSGKIFEEVNCFGSQVVVEESVKAGVKAFIHMSSSAIFGIPEKCPINNNTPLHPIEIYGRSKLKGEQIVQSIAKKNNLPLIIIRPRTILGESRLGIFQVLFDWIKDNAKVYIIGSGNELFQFVHAHDLMDFYMLALAAEKPGTYNIGAQYFKTLREDLEDLIHFANSKSKVISLPEKLTIGTLQLLDKIHLSPLAPWHYLTYHKAFHFDVQPLLSMGWQPKYSNQKMLQESYQWFVQNSEADFSNKSPHRKFVPQKILKLIKILSK